MERRTPSHTPSPPSDDPAWIASDLSAEDYTVRLSPEERDAFARAIAADKPWHAFTRAQVPTACAPLWDRLRGCLNKSAGFCVVSGFPFEGTQGDVLDRARRTTFLVGYGLGTPVFQDARGGRLVDIRSTDANVGDAATYAPRADGTHVRPYETRAAFRLHADACDVAGLFCVQAAARGGSSSIVNALTVYRQLSEARPDLLEVLHQPFYYAKPPKPGEPASYHGIPVFSWQDGYFKSHIVPDLIFISQFVPEVPRLSAVQQEALDVLMKIASEPGLALEITLKAGDLLLLNNHIVWHGRDAYEDAPDSVRHLLRLWLATPDSRPLNPVHEPWFGDPAPGALRGGYLRERLGELRDPP